MPLSARSFLCFACVAVVGALTVACDDKGTAHAARTTTAMDLNVPAPPAEAPLSGELVAKARAVQQAARALAVTCSFDTRSVSWEDVYFDLCAYKKGDAAKLHDAVTALSSSNLVPETGPAASFAEEARMFDAFVAEADKRGPDDYYELYARRARSRGTLWHYQDLASAWNAMVPQDRVAVDEGNNSYALGPPDAGGPRHWERCGGLACVKRTRPEGGAY